MKNNNNDLEILLIGGILGIFGSVTASIFLDFSEFVWSKKGLSEEQILLMKIPLFIMGIGILWVIGYYINKSQSK